MPPVFSVVLLYLSAAGRYSLVALLFKMHSGSHTNSRHGMAHVIRRTPSPRNPPRTCFA